MLRYLTAGESHGKCLLGILEGIPWGLRIDKREIEKELTRRRQGYGRSPRMKIEKDRVELLSGIRKGKTIGSPLALLIENKDFRIDILPALEAPRPGHADLAGALKYNSKDIRDILERASARETAIRVAIGAICKTFLQEFGIKVFSHVVGIGEVCAQTDKLSFSQICARAARSRLMCADKVAEAEMVKEIDRAKEQGDSLGGLLEIIALGLPAGLGSCVHWDRRLDARLSASLMSIPAVKGVEIGAAFLAATRRGSQVHDAIFYTQAKGFFRKSNNAGGLEGGMTNGQPLVLHCAMKPIATLKNPLSSASIRSKHPAKASVQRADVCAVPACGVVGEACAAFCLAQALLEKFGGDSLGETKRNYRGYLAQVKKF